MVQSRGREYLRKVESKQVNDMGFNLEKPGSNGEPDHFRVTYPMPPQKHSVLIPYQRPEGQQADRYALIVQETSKLARLIMGLCTDGQSLNREAALALTALEECRLRANQAIAIYGFGQPGKEHGVKIF